MAMIVKGAPKMQTTSAMRAHMSERERRKLECKIKEVFGEEIKPLSEDLQNVLTDDIVTAFLNRIGLFVEITAGKRYTRTKHSLNQ